MVYLMKMIPEDLVVETYEEVAQFTIEQAHSEMIGMGKAQPDLVAFMVEFTRDVEVQVAEVAMYCLFTVYRMFKKSMKKPLRQVLHKTIVDCYEANETLINKLENTHERFIERIASVQLFDQPYVMKYIVEALFEDDQEDEALSEEDTGYLFLLLKTAADALNKTHGK